MPAPDPTSEAPSDTEASTGAAGLLLAAGAGRRMGAPKALLRDADGTPWLLRAVTELRAAGCAPVVVVLGAAAEEARHLVAGVAGADRVVVADDWAEGMGASLRRGLQELGRSTAAAALVTLVDLPDVGSAVHARVLARWRESGGGGGALLRATYGGEPGHPVLLGRDHWPALLHQVSGDRGAGPYLSGRTVLEVSCEDLATGRDTDRPEQRGERR